MRFNFFRGTIYHRLLRKAGTPIDPKNYKNGLAVIVINYNSTKPCYGLSPTEPDTDFVDSDEEKKTVTVKILPNGNNPDYVLPILIPLLVYVIIGIIALVVVVCYNYSYTNKNANDNANDKANDNVPDEVCTSVQVQVPMKTVNSEYPNYRKSSLYMPLIFIVGIFYFLPAFSAASYKMVEIEDSGNRDICFYNGYCRKPVQMIWKIQDFNHIFSNIGYIILGFIFFLIVEVEKAKSRGIPFWDQFCKTILIKSTDQSEQQQSTVRHFGIYQALALALCMEGFMSSCYHICPTNTNFQFDTTFMYVMGFLIFIKMFQNRHPNQIPSAIHSIFIVSTAMILLVITRYIPDKLPWLVLLFWVIFFIWYSAFICYITDFSWKRYKNIPTSIFYIWYRAIINCFKTEPREEHEDNFVPTMLSDSGFIRTISLAVLNLIYFVYELITKSKNPEIVDVADIFLIIFLGNGLLYVLIYSITKCCRKECHENEKISCKSIMSIILIVCALLFILPAHVFFKMSTTDKVSMCVRVG